MKNEKFKEIVEKLNLEREQWIKLSEISSIILSDGRGVYPNWCYMRFLISDKDELFIRYGESTPYGARLNTHFSRNYDNSAFLFPVNPVPNTQYYENYRLPTTNDILRASDNGELIDEVGIREVQHAYNGLMITPLRPLRLVERFALSFYDPFQYDGKSCMHSDEIDGIYMKFKENPGRLHKKYGVYQEIIRPKEISSINLKLGLYNIFKTYKLE